MDKALKQRLVGASVLIALAVIVLPMLLGGRPEGGAQETQKIELPPQPPELNFETRRYPIGEQGARTQPRAGSSEPDGKITQLPAPRSNAVSPPPVEKKVEAAPDVAPTLELAGKDKTPVPIDEGRDVELTVAADDMPAGTTSRELQSRTAPVSASGRYIVQVASFGTVDNANRLSAVLKENGYAVMTDRAESDVGTLHRVRVGPFESEAEANRAVLALESKISGIKPRIVDLQPEQAAQVTTPADPLVRWVVQVGSFSNVANAEKLVAALRKDGMSAYQENITTSGSSIYRVRIGPFLQREEAIRTERRVREKRSLNGVVMSAD